MVNSINYTESATFKSAELAEYTVDGESYGQFKTAGNLNFLRVYNAGHEVPYYRKFHQFPMSFNCSTQIPSRKGSQFLQNPLLPFRLSHRS